MGSQAAEYLLTFTETTPERYEAMSREELEQALGRWNAWCDELAALGRLRAGNTLAPVARTVSARGRTTVVDGPFTETKELIAGYMLITAASFDEATEIARTCPNLATGMVVEVRPVARACHLARALGWETMRGPAARPA